MKNLVCGFCNQKFPQIPLLETHVLCEHLNDSLFNNTSFEVSNNFEVVKDKQISERKSVDPGSEQIKRSNCDDCGKSFCCKSNLNQHIKCVHEGLKVFSCKLCNKIYTQFNNLKSHIASIHEETKSNCICNDCGKTFFKKSNLNQHINSVHKGIKKFLCKLCDVKFVQTLSLQNHISREHGSKVIC